MEKENLLMPDIQDDEELVSEASLRPKVLSEYKRIPTKCWYS